MNPFMIAQAVLSFGAALFEAYHRSWTLSIVYLAWAVSNGAMAFIGGK